MSTQIDVETLRGWLDARRPVTVLDVRTDEDRAEWAIPGSLHVNAYEALKAGQAGPLAAAVLPADRPVVTVCTSGRVSRAAADILTARGLDARSLEGGMRAWSLAWNQADVPLADPAVRVIQVRRTGKGCLSYLVASGGDAAVVDPAVPPEVYEQLAAGNGWRIQYVVETHVHADHVSRARLLAGRTCARLVLPDQRRVRFPYSPIRDGERLAVGGATMTALRTPGHTDESTCYVLNGAAVVTGDTLFADGVGRPDLHADPEALRRRAAALFASLARLRALGPEVVILPGHTGGPVAFDGRPVAARMAEIAGWLDLWLSSEPGFVGRVTSRLPGPPPNFARIVELNEAGEMPAGEAADLEAGANRCAIGA
jgi:glyoxylase-like metal-dependent hydrolase (beta-lactamase superfamily II)/rhodanese-related sulfurtransferase